MSQPITLRVLTSAGLAFEASAVSVVAPGEVGYLGMLANHAPLVTTIRPGTLRWRLADGSRRAARVGAGVLEIAHNRCTLLTTTVQEAG